MSGNAGLYERMDLELEHAVVPEDELKKNQQPGDDLLDDARKPPVTHDYGFTWQNKHTDN